MHMLYLHGFGSSPQSKKANFFRPFFEARGIPYSVPDLNVPSFEKITLSAMLSRVAETLRELPEAEDVVLMGSSMGGLTALHTYDRYRDSEAKRVKKLVLMAPAFDFIDTQIEEFGVDWGKDWREKGYRNFFDYSQNRERAVHYGFVEDTRTYPSYSVQLGIPALIYHGTKDTVVNPAQSVRFAEGRQNVQLHLVESDHQLLDKTDEILAGVLAFLDLR